MFKKIIGAGLISVDWDMGAISLDVMGEEEDVGLMHPLISLFSYCSFDFELSMRFFGCVCWISYWLDHWMNFYPL